jgi:hypothetical protein
MRDVFEPQNIVIRFNAEDMSSLQQPRWVFESATMPLQIIRIVPSAGRLVASGDTVTDAARVRKYGIVVLC